MKLENILNPATRKENFCITKEMVVNGSVTAETSGQVAGIINGDIEVKGRLTLMKDGILNGDIIAEELMVFGKINGDVKKCNKISVQSGAIIKGNVNTAEIHIEKEAVIEGIITKAGIQLTHTGKKEALKKNSFPKPIESAGGEKAVNAERQKWF